jgi:hypothetical protein
MSSFDSKDSLLESISSSFQSLSKGELSVNELETLVQQTRELYERAVVLRHKAYEKSLGRVEETVVIPVAEVSETLIEEIPEIIVEEKEETVVETAKEEEQPTFDMSFSIFDELETESKPVEETKEEVIITETIQITETVIEPIEEIKEEVVIESIISPLEEVKSEEPVVVTPTPQAAPVVNQVPKDVFDKMLDVSDNSLGSQLMAKKLDSLNGAFGLNEKLQMTHELFNGSSETFYEAIQLFDTLDNFSQAKDVLNKFKEEFAWNLESALITEFVQKISRRYA